MSSPIELVLSKLPKPKRSGRGWVARCPAHNDKRPSLSLSEGQDGRALVHCHAGCSVESIVAALGLAVPDLMPPQRIDALPSSCSARPDDTPVTVYLTAADAVAELEQRHGQASTRWTYADAQGEPEGHVLRWDRAGGKKQILPVSRRNGKWVIGGMPEPRPLYRLPELLGRRGERVYVCEGEKAVDAAVGLGVLATTSVHGAESAARTDWRPLAGREVAILPDNDDAGRKYAAEGAAILGQLDPPAAVRIVELPGLPEKGDIFDMVAEQRAEGKDDSAIRALVEALVQQSQGITPAPPLAAKTHLCHVEPFVSFPLSALPEPIGRFAAEAACAMGCDPSFVALPLLSGLASAIGNTRCIQLKNSWAEPAIVWTAIVGDSGTLKSPALELVLRPIRERQNAAIRRHAEVLKTHENELAEYERAFAIWKRGKSGEPPLKPKEPVPARCWCDDSTVEALAMLLLQNPRGLLMARDELSGWLGSFDRYAQGRGSDVAKWLEMFGGRPMIVDRKTGSARMIYVPRAAVSIAGGIQPEPLRRALGMEYRENGLAARLLLACPPRCAKRWTEAEVSPAVVAAVAGVFEKLFSLQSDVTRDGELQPVVVPLTVNGKAAWIDFYNAHAREHAELTGDLSAAWSKLEGYAARLALVVHLARWAAGDSALTEPNAVDEISISAGGELSAWFGHEARRVYAILSETDADRQRRRLMELIERKGGAVTVREVMRSSHDFQNADKAELALGQLAEAGLGQWQAVQTTEAGGRPTRRFALRGLANADADTTVVKVGK